MTNDINKFVVAGFKHGYLEKMAETLPDVLEQAKGVGADWLESMKGFAEKYKGRVPESHAQAMQQLAAASTPDYLSAIKKVLKDPFMRGSDVPEMMRSSKMMTSKTSVTDPRFFYQQYWPALMRKFGD